MPAESLAPLFLYTGKPLPVILLPSSKSMRLYFWQDPNAELHQQKVLVCCRLLSPRYYPQVFYRPELYQQEDWEAKTSLSVSCFSVSANFSVIGCSKDFKEATSRFFCFGLFFLSFRHQLPDLF
jgi:hypothetical protein